MELQGKIIEVLDPITGTSAKGDWQKQTYVLETEGQYPKKIAFQVWNDNLRKFDICTDDEVTIGIDIESREYEGKWYTDVKAWKCSKGTSTNNDRTTPTNNKPAEQDTGTDNTTEEDDGLPF